MSSDNSNNAASSWWPDNLATNALIATHSSNRPSEEKHAPSKKRPPDNRWIPPLEEEGIPDDDGPPNDGAPGGASAPPPQQRVEKLQIVSTQKIEDPKEPSEEKKKRTPSIASKAKAVVVRKIGGIWKTTDKQPSSGTTASGSNTNQTNTTQQPSSQSIHVSAYQADMMNKWRKTQEAHVKNTDKPLTFEQHFQLAKARQLEDGGVNGALGTTPDDKIQRDAEALSTAITAYGQRPTEQSINEAVARNTATLDSIPSQSEIGRNYVTAVKNKALEHNQKLPPIAIPQTAVPQVQDKVLQEQLKTLHSREPKDYKGQDTQREYDKFVGRSYERALTDPKDKRTPAQLQHDFRHNANTLLGIDKRAAVRLAEAGHSDIAIRNAIARRSPLAKDLPPHIQKDYTRKVTRHLQSPGVKDRIQKAQQIKQQFGVSKDNRSLQRLEAARRDYAISKVRDIHTKTTGAPVKESEVFQSNYRERDSRGIAESRERHNIEVAKAHLPPKDYQSKEAINHAGRVVSKSPDAAAHSYSPKQQQEYGRAIAYHAAHSDSINHKPERTQHKQTNERYVHNFQRFNTQQEQQRQQKQEQQKMQAHHRAEQRERTR